MQRVSGYRCPGCKSTDALIGQSTAEPVTSAESRRSEQDDDHERKCDDDPFDPSECLGRRKLVAVDNRVASAVEPSTDRCRECGGTDEPEEPTVGSNREQSREKRRV